MNDPMQPVLHYLPHIRLAEGGVVRAVVDLCDAIARAGRPVILATADTFDAQKIWPDTPENLTILPIDRPLGARGPIKQPLRDAVRRASVVHLHTPWDRGNLALAREARRAGVPYILSLHGMLDDWCMSQRSPKKRLYLALAGRRLLEHAAAVHCTARAEWTQAKRWAPKAVGVVAPLVFDLSDYSDLPGETPAIARWPALGDDRPALLFLSRIHYKKGADVFLDAAGLLRERGSDAAFFIAGPGDDADLRALRDQADRIGLTDRVHFLGMVTGVEKVSLYQAADMFVLPTSQENFGFVFFEALAAGTPVVTTRGVDTWPELEDSGGAIITERDANRIAEAVAPLLADRPRLTAMGESGRAWTLERFAPGAVIREYLDLYNRLAVMQYNR